jgi:hypothetical protein
MTMRNTDVLSGGGDSLSEQKSKGYRLNKHLGNGYSARP